MAHEYQFKHIPINNNNHSGNVQEQRGGNPAEDLEQSQRRLELTPIVSPLTPNSPALFAAERPFIWNEIDVGGRSLIATIPSGGLLVHSPVELTDELNSELNAIGDVRIIISPNYEHLKYAKQWHKAFPKAEMWACPGLPERITDVFWNRNEDGDYR